MMGLTKIKSLFAHPRQPFIYAVTAGKYLGELLVYAEKKSDNYIFLSLPDMGIRRIPVEKFDLGIKDKIVDVVEKLPAYVHRTCMMQYNKNKGNTVALEREND